MKRKEFYKELSMQVGHDPERIRREKSEAEQRERDSAEYQHRMQRALNLCPGLVGADAPSGPGRPGRVVVDPRQANDAMAWLKRRYRVSESAVLTDENLVLEIISRAASARDGATKRLRVSFDKPVQFELDL